MKYLLKVPRFYRRWIIELEDFRMVPEGFKDHFDMLTLGPEKWLFHDSKTDWEKKKKKNLVHNRNIKFPEMNVDGILNYQLSFSTKLTKYTGILNKLKADFTNNRFRDFRKLEN
ncbi:hypothetical protein C0J52_17158 [Blattella germanica]|nr:hypothetical protein C0J52_17158 [Blattella germanica]